jgi:hypothetical protein
MGQNCMTRQNCDRLGCPSSEQDATHQAWKRPNWRHCSSFSTRQDSARSPLKDWFPPWRRRMMFDSKLLEANCFLCFVVFAPLLTFRGLTFYFHCLHPRPECRACARKSTSKHSASNCVRPRQSRVGRNQPPLDFCTRWCPERPPLVTLMMSDHRQFTSVEMT